MATTASKPANGPPPQSLDFLKQSVSSIETCTSSTVSALNTIFFPPPIKPSNRAPASRTTAAKTTNKRKRRILAGAEPEKGLSTLEKYRLATEVVNSTLKTLNTVSKQAQTTVQPPVQANTKDEVQASAKVKKLLKATTQPLKSKSLNRANHPPPAALPHPAIWTAECSLLAINYIHSLRNSAELPLPPPTLQIETAQHSLIVRLIILKLYDIALRELRVLKRRLEESFESGEKTGIESWIVYEKDEKANKKPKSIESKNERSKAAEAKEESMASLLAFKKLPQEASVIELVMGFQMSVMRCMLGVGMQGAIEALVASLSTPYSTLSLVKSLPNPASKLAALDILLFSFCPSTSTSADLPTKNTHPSSPNSVLRLQAYALEARFLARSKKAEELWEYLSKCLTAFCRRCTPKEGGKERYKFVRDIILRFQKTLGGELPDTILHMLSTVAQESGYGAEALKWLEQANTTLDQKGSSGGKELNDAAKAVRFVKIATLSLKYYASTLTSGPSSVVITAESITDILDKVKLSIESVDVVAKVRKEDLEKLLHEVALFRRAATIVAITPLPCAAEECDDLVAAWKCLREACESVSEMAIKFFRKYISLQANNGEKVKRLTVPVVDFITSRARQEAATGGQMLLNNWERLDESLMNCLDLARTIEEQEAEQRVDMDGEKEKSGEESSKDSMFEKISSAYWKAACSLKKLEAQVESLKAMKRSVSSLIGRPKEETVRGGLVTKIERLGNGFYQVGDIGRAEEAFSEGIKALIVEGILEEILLLADNTSLYKIFGDDTVGMMLGRMLDGLVKCVSRDSQKRRKKAPTWDGVPFDAETLNRETRGLILEWQLRGLCGLGVKDLWMIKSVAERLLDLYMDEEPLRRARVISKILKCQVDNPTFMDRSLVLGLGEEVETLVPLHRDASLKPHRADIVSSCLVFYAFLNYQDSEPRPDILQTALLTWRKTVENCRDWEHLLDRIEDPEELIAQLHMLVDFFELKGLSFHRITALRSLILIKAVEIEIDYNALIKLHSLLGTQYLRMGYSGKAGIALAKARSWTAKEGVWEETKVLWHLAYTEYLVGIGNMEKANEQYDAATKIVNGDTSIFESRKVGSKLERRVILNRIIAEASYVMSLLCFELGKPNDSLCHVRRCIRLNQRSWAVLEQLCKDTAASTTKDSYPRLVPIHPTPDVQKLIKGVGRRSDSHNSNSIPLPVQSTTFIALNAPLLWTLVTSMYLSLVQASLLYRHQGMVREAIFNMEQALKTVEAVGATPLIAQALSIFGDLKIRAGLLSEGADMLERATDLRAEIEKSKEIVHLDCTVGYLHMKNGLWEEEWGAYEHAEAKLTAIMSPRFIKNIDDLQSAGDDDDDREELRQPEEQKPRTQKKGTLGHARTKSAGKAATAATLPAKQDKGVITECKSLHRMRGNILRMKAYNLAMQSQCDQADLLLREAAELPLGQHEVIYQRLAAAKHLLLEGLTLLSSDPVFCVLQDSTISLPSVAPTKALIQNPIEPLKKGKKASTPKEPEVVQNATSKFVDILTKARDTVADIHYHAAKVGSTSIVHSVSMLLSGVIVLLSAVTSGKEKGMGHPLFASYSLELNKGLPLLREKDVIEAERAAAGGDSVAWPQVSPLLSDSFKSVSVPFSFSSFQKDHIDIIPQSWAAVSISLSEAQDELYISRFQAGQGQFMLRLPLTRHNSRDDAEETFEFEVGMEALREILEKANTSTHNAKEATAGGKASKTEWWAERESLDAQLGELLLNIENCWLGGFKGIFGQYPRHPDLLRRFRLTFEKILAKHLPSRQTRRAGKKGSSSTVAGEEPVKIDPRVLDLFVGLGDPLQKKSGASGEDKSEDMDASLVDLLWFIFDILQFHGERNAYDEIDVDAIVVDVTDALCAYYQQVGSMPKAEWEGVQHTILILDKNVHQIPWESLPCLDGHAISRLPSLASLREILVGKKMDTDQVKPGVYVDENKGAWILNPGGDLTSTHSTFENELSSLPPSWTGIASRAPSEQEFRDALDSSDILLYFGHGSGAQFIRARTVKKLDECAVALLMGCSSGALKEAGEFQPYGMPLAYLLGGSAAVVANLWDVTDKDIDKFSKKALEEWGLFSSSSASRYAKTGVGEVGKTPAKTPRKRSKSRGRDRTTDDTGLFGTGVLVGEGGGGGKGKVSLVEAVARGRAECHLKYLNGAAPVVYGVPVYLA